MEDLKKLLTWIHSLVLSDGSQKALAAFRVITDGTFLISALRSETAVESRELCSLLQDTVVAAADYLGVRLSEDEMRILTMK